MTDSRDYPHEQLAPRVYKLEGEVSHLASSVDSLNGLISDLGSKIDGLSSRGRIQPSIIISAGALMVGLIATLSAFVVYTNHATIQPVNVRVSLLEASVNTNERAIIDLLQRTSKHE
jgi:cell division protein FtsL